MTAETNDAPAAERAITPARDLVNDAIVALQANPKNFSHRPTLIQVARSLRLLSGHAFLNASIHTNGLRSNPLGWSRHSSEPFVECQQPVFVCFRMCNYLDLFGG
jgi:hypothetical protein